MDWYRADQLETRSISPKPLSEIAQLRIIYTVSPMPLADYPELQKLSRRAKNQLAEELWQAANADAPVTAAQRRTLDSRWADYKSGKTPSVPYAEFKRLLNSK